MTALALASLGFVSTARADLGAYALHFAGAETVNATPSDLPLGSSAYTIEAWIKASAMGGYGIVGWGNYGTDNQVNALRLNSGGFDGVHNYWWNNDLSAVTGDITGTWHHVAATYDGTTQVIYLDGVAMSSRTSPTPPNVQIGNFAIGKTNGTEYFLGDIAEVRVWTSARTASEIQGAMNSQLTGSEPGLVSLYGFEEGTGTTTSDQAGTADDGVLSPGVTWVALAAASIAAAPAFAPTTLVSSSSATIAVTNTGAAPFQITSMVKSGSDVGDFTIGQGTCAGVPPTVAPGTSCALSVSFAPHSLGTRSATLTIQTTAANLPQIALFLQGTGVSATAIPTLSEWGMIALALGLAGSMLVARRKKQA